MFKKIIDKHPILAVIVFMALAMAPVMVMRDFSPSNELRYLSIADEAITDGDVFAFTNHGEDYADKPPFYFWLIMLSRMLFGEHSMLALSLLSFIPACVIIAVMDAWLRKAFPGLFSSTERAGAALLLGSCALFLGLSVFVRMDMMMCMWIVLALWTFWRLDNGIGRTELQKWALPLYIFMALFTKGPVGLLAPVVSIVVFLLAEKRPKDILKYLGLRTWAVIALLCLPWFVGAWLDGGSDYLKNLLFHQTMGRAVNSFHHKAPVWQYLLVIWGVVAPWCLALVPATVMALLRKGEDKPSNAEKFFALTSISVLLMLSLFSSKIAIYLAPVFPFLAYVFPVVAKRRGWNHWFGFSLTVPAVLMVFIGILTAGTAVLCITVPTVPEIISYPFLGSPLVLIAGAILLLGGVRALKQTGGSKGEWEKPVTTMACAIYLTIFVVGMKLPQVNDYIGYANLCKLIPEDTEQVYTMSVQRPENMDVYLGRDIYDFGKDAESFMMIAPRKGTLIVSTSFLGDHEDIMEYLEDQDFQFCGKYAVYTLNKVIKGNKTSSDKPEKEKRRRRNRRSATEQ